MIVLSDPRWLVLLVPLFAWTLWTWGDGPFHLGPRRKRATLVMRLVLITAIDLGLCGLSVALPQGRQAVVFVADLSASNAVNKSAMEASINTATAHRPDDGLAGVVSVGSNAEVEQPALPLAAFSGFQANINPDYTNLERGLELAGASLPDGYRRRIVLMSDGQQNVGDAVSAARLLHAQGVRVDVMPQHVTGGPDVRVDRVDVPSQMHTRERFSLVVSLHSSVNTPTRIDVYRDHSLVGSRTESVVVGETQYVFPQQALGPGVHTFQVRIAPRIDSQPQNNTGSALTTIEGAPRVLIVAATRSDGAIVLQSLRSTGIQAEIQAPGRLLPTLTNLQQYAAVVVVNTPAVAFDPVFLTQLVPYVRDLGRGLVVIGGQDAYGLGGYGNTPLEQVLPVRMDLPKRRQVPSVAVALVIESLEAPLPVNISKEAGRGVIRLLTEQDQVAVNTAPDNGTPGWIVPLQHPRDKALLYRTISQMVPGDPNKYTEFLRTGYLMLKDSHARIKHIILLGDGDARDRAYESTVRAIRAGGVTVSTVVSNAATHSDFITMKNIARWGGGRYYHADDVANVPKIFLREARSLAHAGVIAGKFYPLELSANPILREMRSVPPLFGYVATAAKPSAEVVLASRKMDPVLATWQFGLGRTAAWTSDAAGLWTKNWLASSGANTFWANLVSWTFPPSSGNHLFVSATSAGGQGQVAVDTPPQLGIAPNVTARVVSPNLHVSSIQLQPAAPGSFRGVFPATSQGAYFVTVEAHGAGHGQVGQTGVAVPYSTEYQSTGTDMAFLDQVARAGGGVIAEGSQSVWRDNLEPVYDQRSLADALWLLALLLLPVDIALRRVVVGTREMGGLREALSFDRTRPGARRSQPRTVPTGAPPGPLVAARQTLGSVLSVASRARSPSPTASPPVPAAQRAENYRVLQASPRAQSPVPAPQSSVARLLEAKRRKQAMMEGEALSD
ncbi:MAG: VWA domain-containing protein [Chloroflexota bacterium]